MNNEDIEIALRQGRLEQLYKQINRTIEIYLSLQAYSGSKQSLKYIPDIENECRNLANRIKKISPNSPGIDELTELELQSLIKGAEDIISLLANLCSYVAPDAKEFVENSKFPEPATMYERIRSFKESVTLFMQLSRSMAATADMLKQKQEPTIKIEKLENEIKELKDTLDSKVLAAVHRKEDAAKIKNVIETNVIEEIDKLTAAERDATHNWLYAGIIFFVFSLLYASLIFISVDQVTELAQDKDTHEDILKYILIKVGLRDLFILTGLSTTAMICFTQHKQHKLNYTSYKHKKFSLRTFESLTSKTLQTDTQNIIVEKAMSAIFSPPEMSRDSSTDSTSNVINFLKAPLDSEGK